MGLLNHPFLASRRSQITLIVIVGLVMVFVFVFLFSLRKALPGQKETSTPNKLLYELESGLVKDHITSCVQKLSSDAVERIGANGGVIYDFEGGRVPLADLVAGVDYLNYTLGGRIFLVKYGLRENRFCPLVNYSKPGYPYPDRNLSDLPGMYASADSCMYAHTAADYDGFYGQNNLSKLCPFSEASTCQNFAKGEVIGLTIERQIEDYLANKLPLCVNLSAFGEQFNADLEQDGNIRPMVSVRDNDIQIAVAYPFKITYKNEVPITKLVEYQTALKVRLGAVYSFAYELISRDARELFFNLSNQALATSSYRAGFEFKRIADPCSACYLPYKYDDLFEIRDADSIVNGKPFLFRFAIQNRAPALDLIPVYNEYDLSVYNVPLISMAFIPLSASDPDDAGVKLIFMSEGYDEGWRENEDVFFTPDERSFFRMSLASLSDFGNRSVGVLVVDDSGLFDFQRFNLDIRDSGMTFPTAQICLNACDSSVWDCNKWCWFSANPCQSFCQADYLVDNPYCVECVGNMYFADQLEKHVECPEITSKETCISNMPDCFWIEEDAGEGLFEGSCYNDWDLWKTKHPAFISLS